MTSCQQENAQGANLVHVGIASRIKMPKAGQFQEFWINKLKATKQGNDEVALKLASFWKMHFQLASRYVMLAIEIFILM